MTRSISWLAVSALIGVGLWPALAGAAPMRVFVSGHGTDTGACPLATPCRTLAYAVSQVAAAGEIYILDGAGYGAATITTSLSIVNDGDGTAGVTAAGAGGTAITISIGPTDTVHLRGLSFDGGGTAATGIKVTSGGSVDIANCVIRHFASFGIFATAATGTIGLSVENAVISDNLAAGIEVKGTSSGSVTATAFNVTMNNNYDGAFADGFSTTGTVQLMIYNSVASNNVTNGFDEQYAVLRISRSTAAGNAVGVHGTSGLVYSSGDNSFFGNTTNVGATLTSVPPM